MVRIAIILLLLILSGCTKNTVTLGKLLSEMISAESASYFPYPEYRLLQASSYNRKSVSPDSAGWFENNDMSHFIRIEENQGRREFVMLDTDGPGAIVRWWMTFYKAQEGIIRIYLDNSEDPVIAGAPDDLLSGSLLAPYPFSASVQEGAPLGEEGRDYDYNLYLPVPFSKHCKITYECDSLRILYDYEGTNVPEGYYWPDVFYNINYRLYDKTVSVTSFTMKELGRCRKKIRDAGTILLSEAPLSGRKVSGEMRLLPGDSLVLSDHSGPSAVGSLRARIISSCPDQSLRSVVLSIRTDGIASVWVPAGDFFGSGYTSQTHRTLFNSRDSSGMMSSFRIMPYRKNISISFVNYGKDTVDVRVMADLIPYRWNDRSMYFGASWHEYHRLRTRDASGSPFDLTFIKLTGKGVYVGDQLTLFNDTYHWWGEGDEKTFVDNEPFPSIFGTGSEDYYGYSFGRREAFSHPFLSQPVGIGNMARGVTINMRHRALDAIPFRKSIDSRIEMWHWADIEMNIALTSYYYFFDPVIRNIKPDIPSVRKKVAVHRHEPDDENE
ncbi:MAG TPA: DUF2961 domain-containing protein [Bacteroidales bacterium]|nr:DUF2961 domain-containing protein [Bacteroidales bacterium]HNR42595.1 DUF2961 domain-containing protein [Bacteroidales bacterium]HPM18211.1 DUF2961 domain-containing protein [Bacteroidales bacterium]